MVIEVNKHIKTEQKALHKRTFNVNIEHESNHVHDEMQNSLLSQEMVKGNEALQQLCISGGKEHPAIRETAIFFIGVESFLRKFIDDHFKSCPAMT